MHPYMHRCSIHVRFPEAGRNWGKLLHKSWGTLIQHVTLNKCISEQHKSENMELFMEQIVGPHYNSN